MTRTVTRSRAKSNKNLSAGDILTAANTDLYDDYTQVTMFTTAFVGCFDPQTRDLVYANAGHAPVIYYTNGSATMLRPDNIPLGVLPDVDYIDHHLTLSPGDVLAIATDGFNEARKPGGEMLGYEKLIQAVVTCAHESAAVIARTLFDMIHLYAKGEPQADDQTLLVMKVVPSSSDGELDEHE